MFVYYIYLILTRVHDQRHTLQKKKGWTDTTAIIIISISIHNDEDGNLFDGVFLTNIFVRSYVTTHYLCDAKMFSETFVTLKQEPLFLFKILCTFKILFEIKNVLWILQLVHFC